MKEIDVLWINAGLSCDGDTIAMTAATQPSIEDIVRGGLPWIPKVNFHNLFLAYENGDEFMARFHRAAKGELDPFILVVEGSIPDETNKAEGYWASFGTDPETGQPILTTEWIDRLAPKAWAIMAAGTCATYGGIHAMEGNPTGCMGLADYLGWKWKSKAGIPIVCIPGCPVQPDNFMETLLYLLHMAAGRAPMIPLDEALRPTWLFGQTVHEGCDRGGYYEQARVRGGVRSAHLHREAGMLGSGGAMQRREARLDGRESAAARTWAASASDAPCRAFPDKFMPFMNQPPGSLLSSQAVMTYGRAIHALRRFTQASLNKEPSWRGAQERVMTKPTAISDSGIGDAGSDSGEPGRRVFSSRRPMPASRAEESGADSGSPLSRPAGSDSGGGVHGVSGSGHRRGLREPADRSDAGLFATGMAGRSGALVPADPSRR